MGFLPRVNEAASCQRATKLAKILIAQNPGSPGGPPNPSDLGPQFLPRVDEVARASIFATCKQGGFVPERTTKSAKELIAQNPPQDGLQTRATSGLVFARQAAAADVAGSSSRRQRAGSGSKQARVTDGLAYRK